MEGVKFKFKIDGLKKKNLLFRLRFLKKKKIYIYKKSKLNIYFNSLLFEVKCLNE